MGLQRLMFMWCLVAFASLTGCTKVGLNAESARKVDEAMRVVNDFKEQVAVLSKSVQEMEGTLQRTNEALVEMDDTIKSLKRELEAMRQLAGQHLPVINALGFSPFVP